MLKFIYLDACVWIVFLNEKDERHATVVKLFEKIMEEGYKILVSSAIAYELKGKWYSKYCELKDELYRKGIVLGVKVKETDKVIAYKLDSGLGFGYGDFLHLVVAKRFKAKPVSFDEDWHDIASFMNIRVYYPEELL